MSDIERDDLNNSFERLLFESDEDTMMTDDSDQNSDSSLALSDVSSKNESDEEDLSRVLWSDHIMTHDNWNFTDQWGMNSSLLNLCEEPIDFFDLFFTLDIQELIVKETNKYAQSKNPAWELTTPVEIRKFIALCMQMGIVRLPCLRDYWSERSIYGGCPIGSKVMCRRRFESLMTNLHFADNLNYDGKNRLFKISSFINLINVTFEKVYKPGQRLCIDESLVPFRGRIVFRQYIPNKRHRYGIKLFKLCTNGGYTSHIEIYAGKDEIRTGSVATSIVLKLMNNLMDCGRTLYTDNWYSSVPLAETLIQRKTHLVGTIRKNRRGLPKEVTEVKLKKGMLTARQNKKGITVMKWRDKRDIFVISTKHDDSLNSDGKPKIISDYNSGKVFVDISDQMASYTPFLRKTAKWYIRIFFHVLTQTALVNAWRLYHDNVKNIKFNDFKISVVESMLQTGKQTIIKSRHHLEELESPKSLSRKRCLGCYKEISKKEGRQNAISRAKKVNTRCNKCKKHFCVSCFHKFHVKCG